MKRTRKATRCRVCNAPLRAEDKRDGRCFDCYANAERRRMNASEPKPVDRDYAQERAAWSRWKRDHGNA